MTASSSINALSSGKASMTASQHLRQKQTRRSTCNFCLTFAASALLLICASLHINQAANVQTFLSFDASIMISASQNTTTQFSTPSDHTPLLPLQATDLLGFLLASLGLILASGGGIGGGGMLVPIYILVMGFLPKHAIPLSNVTVFGGAVANTWWNGGRRHPAADR